MLVPTGPPRGGKKGVLLLLYYCNPIIVISNHFQPPTIFTPLPPVYSVLESTVQCVGEWILHNLILAKFDPGPTNPLGGPGHQNVINL